MKNVIGILESVSRVGKPSYTLRAALRDVDAAVERFDDVLVSLLVKSPAVKAALKGIDTGKAVEDGRKVVARFTDIVNTVDGTFERGGSRRIGMEIGEAVISTADEAPVQVTVWAGAKERPMHGFKSVKEAMAWAERLVRAEGKKVRSNLERIQVYEDGDFSVTYTVDRNPIAGPGTAFAVWKYVPGSAPDIVVGAVMKR